MILVEDSEETNSGPTQLSESDFSGTNMVRKLPTVEFFLATVASSLLSGFSFRFETPLVKS